MVARCSPVSPVADGGVDSGGSDAGANAIGPGGGTVRDSSGTVTVEVPAGALTTTVAIGVELTTDDTPLPNGAIRIGPQFKITPTGTAFAQPVRVTLPFDAADRERLGNDPMDVKVWVRTSDGWRLTEPVAVTQSTVTITLTEATTAAAGVRLREFAPTCGLPGLPSCVMPMELPPVPLVPMPAPTCAGNFCTQVVVDPATNTERIAMPTHAIVQDDKLYWFTGTNARRVGLNGGSSAVVPRTVQTGLFNIVGSSVAVDRDGNFWAGMIRFTFGPGSSQRPTFPVGAGLNTNDLPMGQSSEPLEIVRAADGSIHGYQRVVQIAGMQPRMVTDVAMRRWTMQPDLTVGAPVALAQAVGRSLVVRPDPTQPGVEWLFGHMKPAVASALLVTEAGIDGVRILRVGAMGEILASLDVPVQPNGLSRNGFSNTGLCDTDTCNAFQQHSFSVRGTELLAPTQPSILSTTSLQRLDGASPMLTRTSVALPQTLDPVIDVSHDSQGGVWLFTRGTNRSQVWHFNRMSNVLSPISLGMRTPFGLTSDGGDGAIVLISANGGNPTGLLRVRRLVTP